MAKVIVDENACIGCGLCVNGCPDCFTMDDNGIAKSKAGSCQSCNLQEIAAQCPVNAIVVED